MIRALISGDKPVLRKLSKLKHIDRLLKPGMQDAVLYVHSRVPKYPIAPTHSTYIRTGTLGRSVTTLQGQAPGALSRVESINKGVVGLVGTNVKYGKWVIDRRRQAHMHRGRWYVLQDVVEKALPGIKKILRRAIDAAIRG